MWIQGRRRGGAKALATHLRKTDENESVAVKELEGFSHDAMTGENLENALKQMEAIGYGKGGARNLFHTIIAPAYGETLTAAQQKVMVNIYAEQMGFKGHQYALVEHWKKGKQHFHLVFNIIDPATGKTHELKWSKQKEWNISRDLEKAFGLSTPQPKGKASRTWETQRGKRTGIDTRKMRKEVTAIFRASSTAQEFATALDKAGYTLTRTHDKKLLLVDKFGDTHGLMRRIEGKTLADLRQKFTDIGTMPLPDHASVVKARKSTEGAATSSPRIARPSRTSGNKVRITVPSKKHVGTPVFVTPSPTTPTYTPQRPTEPARPSRPTRPIFNFFTLTPKQAFQPAMRIVTKRRRSQDENIPDSEKPRVPRPDADLIELLIWAWEHKRADILLQFGIVLPPDFEF